MLDKFNKYIMSIVSDAYKCMDERTLSMPGIQGYIRHLPIIGITEGYPQEIYVNTAKCIIALWKYAKCMNFISPNTTFLDFMGNDIGFKECYNDTELKYELSDGRIVSWQEYLEPLTQMVHRILPHSNNL